MMDPFLFHLPDLELYDFGNTTTVTSPLNTSFPAIPNPTSTPDTLESSVPVLQAAGDYEIDPVQFINTIAHLASTGAFDENIVSVLSVFMNSAVPHGAIADG